MYRDMVATFPTRTRIEKKNTESVLCVIPTNRVQALLFLLSLFAMYLYVYMYINLPTCLPLACQPYVFSIAQLQRKLTL